MTENPHFPSTNPCAYRPTRNFRSKRVAVVYKVVVWFISSFLRKQLGLLYIWNYFSIATPKHFRFITRNPQWHRGRNGNCLRFAGLLTKRARNIKIVRNLRVRTSSFNKTRNRQLLKKLLPLLPKYLLSSLNLSCAKMGRVSIKWQGGSPGNTQRASTERAPLPRGWLSHVWWRVVS